MDESAHPQPAPVLDRVNCSSCPIRHNDVFATIQEGVDDATRTAIDKHFHPSGQVIYNEGATGDTIYSVCAGLVKLMQHRDDGTQRIVRILHQGDVFGTELLTDATYRHTAVSLYHAVTCRVSAHALIRMADSSAAKYLALIKRLQDNMDEADFVLTHLLSGHAQQRVARLLLHLMPADQPGRCPSVSREDMGALLNLTAESASRVVAEMKRQGVLSETRDVFSFDVAAIERACEA